jgi:putative transposase
LIAVGEGGYHEILGIMEGHKEDKAGWSGFLRHLKERGLKGVQLIISDACMGLKESVGDFYPEADWQRCIVHWYRNIFSHVPSTKVREVSLMLKAIHAQESRQTAVSKIDDVKAKLVSMKLRKVADWMAETAFEIIFEKLAFNKGACKLC